MTDKEKRLLVLIKVYDPGIKSYISTKVYDFHQSENMYQELMYFIFKSAHTFDIEKEHYFMGWVKKIVTNIHINNYYRDKKIVLSSEFDESEELYYNFSQKEVAHSNINYSLLVNHILDMLDFRYHNLFLEHFVHQASISEIAESQNVNADSLETYVNRIKYYIQSRIKIEDWILE